LIAATDINSFNTLIAKALAEGWKLHGQLVVTPSQTPTGYGVQYTQAFVKSTSLQDENNQRYNNNFFQRSFAHNYKGVVEVSLHNVATDDEYQFTMTPEDALSLSDGIRKSVRGDSANLSPESQQT